MNKKIGLIIGFIVLLILIIGLPFAIKLVQERQNPQKQAAVPGGSAIVSLSAASTATVQQRIPVTISFKVPSSPNGILGLRTTVNITSSGSSPLVSVSASDIDNSFGSSLQYYDPIINTNGATTTITLQAAYTKAGTSGFLGANGDTPVSFAVINLLATDTGTIDVNFDMNDSFINDKGGNLDIMNDQAGGKSITIASDTIPTATATPTSATTTGTIAPTATVTPTSTTASGTITPTATATPTSTGRGGGSATNTPTPTRTAGATNTPTPIASNPDQVKLTSIVSGQTVATTKPTFSGTALPNSTITITVHSDPITATVTTDASGRWTWTPTEDLGPGSHTVTITAVTPTGKTTTTTSTFTVGSLPVTGNVSLTLILLGCGLLILLPVLVGLVKKSPIHS